MGFELLKSQKQFKEIPVSLRSTCAYILHFETKIQQYPTDSQITFKSSWTKVVVDGKYRTLCISTQNITWRT